MQQRQNELKRFKKDMYYYEAHREELLEQHPEQWVAIFNENVVDVAPEADQLLKDLKDQGIPAEHVFVQHLTRKDELLILTL